MVSIRLNYRGDYDSIFISEFDISILCAWIEILDCFNMIIWFIIASFLIFLQMLFQKVEIFYTVTTA